MFTTTAEDKAPLKPAGREATALLSKTVTPVTSSGEPPELLAHGPGPYYGVVISGAFATGYRIGNKVWVIIEEASENGITAQKKRDELRKRGLKTRVVVRTRPATLPSTWPPRPS